MRTTLAIKEELLDEVKALSGAKTKKDAVERALEEFIKKRRQKDILALFGKIEMREDYDYKQERRHR
ncbi:MAG: type II toxin-antitoxin system VapB family antitoxin [Deltaproteobacteria bacterium]|nr:type II toxin-antitoxin system VapB family antitoxin [Deltaproteobacteria bacterium]